MSFTILVHAVEATATLAAVCLGAYKVTLGKGSQPRNVASLTLSKQNGRNQFRVAIIDDESAIRFPNEMREALRKRGFNVDYFEDVISVEQIDQYQIVLCDIKGVGKNLALGKSFHGGIIVSELRRRRPLAYIIIYSSLTYKLDFKPYLDLADEAADKGRLEEDSLAATIDNAIQILTSPEQQWDRVEKWILRDQQYKPREVEKMHKKFMSAFAAGGGITLESRLRISNLAEGGIGETGIDLARDSAAVIEQVIDLL